MASKLKDELLDFECDDNNLYIIPTKSDNSYRVLLTYSSENFEENIPDVNKTIRFAESLKGKKVIIYGIDKEHTNPYRIYEKTEEKTTAATVELLREAGKLKPIYEGVYDKDEITLKLTANSSYLIAVE